MGFKGGHQDGPVAVILSLQEGDELVPADPVDGTVLELTADHAAGLLDIPVPGLMAQGVVDLLQTVHIKDHHAEFPDGSIGNTLIQQFFGFNIRVGILDAGQGICIGQVTGGTQLQLLTLFTGKHFLQLPAAGKT